MTLVGADDWRANLCRSTRCKNSRVMWTQQQQQQQQHHGHSRRSRGNPWRGSVQRERGSRKHVCWKWRSALEWAGIPWMPGGAADSPSLRAPTRIGITFVADKTGGARWPPLSSSERTSKILSARAVHFSSHSATSALVSIVCPPHRT